MLRGKSVHQVTKEEPLKSTKKKKKKDDPIMADG